MIDEDRLRNAAEALRCQAEAIDPDTTVDMTAPLVALTAAVAEAARRGDGVEANYLADAFGTMVKAYLEMGR